MKTIGIIGAMEEEITQIKSRMDVILSKSIVGADYYFGKMHGRSIVLVRSGIGKVNAAICTQILIDLYAIDYCINIGVAGAINKELEIGDVVISRDVVHHDFDTTAFGDPIGTIPRLDVRFFPADDSLIKLAQESGKEVLENNRIFSGRVASGDQFVSASDVKAKIWNDTKADCTEMEGAAIAQTCFLNKIPFVVIRSISDKADHQADNNFEKFVKMASEYSSEIVENMIKLM